MCYIQGSLDQAINVCPMCKVFPSPRCPHVREICRNRNAHPRADVLYLKNAEVEWFNGCGFCKWARTNPPPKMAGHQNPGWPGCCRSPAPNEYRLIQAADWRAVSIVHHVPIPPDIKAALESFSSRASPIPSKAATLGRSSSARVMPTLDRRNSGSASPSSKAMPGKSPAMPIPSKGRSGGSPQQSIATLSRSSSGNAISSSVPSSSSLDQLHFQRRLTLTESSDKRPEGLHSAHSSPNRKHLDLDSTTSSKRHSGGRPSVNAPSPSVSVSKIVVDATSLTKDIPERRRASVSGSISPSNKSSPSGSRSAERSSPPAITRSPKRDVDEMSTASSGSGSDSHGSMSDSTVTSDGGFTDYLSDESEAELQRQAEARAALLAQSYAEEMEFKAARQQLAHVDLRPPKTWKETSNTVRLTSSIPYMSNTSVTSASRD